jgi:hypothetical protein
MIMPVDLVMMIAVGAGWRVILLPIMTVPVRVYVPGVPVRVGMVSMIVLIIRIGAKALHANPARNREANDQAQDGGAPAHGPYCIGQPNSREDH